MNTEYFERLIAENARLRRVVKATRKQMRKVEAGARLRSPTLESITMAHAAERTKILRQLRSAERLARFLAEETQGRETADRVTAEAAALGAAREIEPMRAATPAPDLMWETR